MSNELTFWDLMAVVVDVCGVIFAFLSAKFYWAIRKELPAFNAQMLVYASLVAGFTVVCVIDIGMALNGEGALFGFLNDRPRLIRPIIVMAMAYFLWAKGRSK